MTNNEIDKLLGLMDKNSLSEVKEYLLNERTKNDNRARQITFERYLTKNANNSHLVICKDYKERLIFSNNISIYSIYDLSKFKISKKISLNMSEKTDDNRKTILKDESFFNPIFNKLNSSFSSPTDVVSIEPNEFTALSYVYGWLFNSKEIKTADILLGKPNYMVSEDNPILCGENEIGKVYILGIDKGRKYL